MAPLPCAHLLLVQHLLLLVQQLLLHCLLLLLLRQELSMVSVCAGTPGSPTLLGG